MSGPMTPTEQDKELRELVHIVQNADTTYDAMQFIKADRKRVALEARIEGLLMAKYGNKDNSFEEKFIDNLIQQLNTDKEN